MLLVYVSKEDNFKFAKFNGIEAFLTESKGEEFEELRNSPSIICITKDFTSAPAETDDSGNSTVTYEDILTTLSIYSNGNANFKDHAVKYFKSLDWWRELTLEVLKEQEITKIHDDLLDSTVEGIWNNLDDLYDLFNDRIMVNDAKAALEEAIKVTFCDKE